jgi:hypothetical protein
MFTSIDKAIVALVMAVIYFLNTYLNTGITISPEAVNALVLAILPFLVYFIPNKKVA